MISQDFIKECCDINYCNPIAIKLQVPLFMTATKEIPLEFLRCMQIFDVDWLFFVIPRRVGEQKLTEFLNIISPYVVDSYFVV